MFSTANATAQLDFLTANYYAALEISTAVVAIIILISAADDLLFDLWYWTRRLYRKFTVERFSKSLTSAQLREREEQPLAIMVPAWLEYDVIAHMIENMVAVLDYHRYVVFVGIYVNDRATIDQVERMRSCYKQLHWVEVPHEGPTCKADCLNFVVKAIFAYESEYDMQFAGVVLHDSEDVLHPLELKFFNYLLPRKDMIQLPVASLERAWYELVAGTYMDEFAESHAKDMMVRESVAGIIPSVGVGTCFSRKAVSYAPDNLPYCLLLILALLHAGELDDAMTAASETHALAPSAPTPLLLRGYLYQRRAQDAAAAQDFSAAALAGAEQQASTTAFIAAVGKARQADVAAGLYGPDGLSFDRRCTSA